MRGRWGLLALLLPQVKLRLSQKQVELRTAPPSDPLTDLLL